MHNSSISTQFLFENFSIEAISGEARELQSNEIELSKFENFEIMTRQPPKFFPSRTGMTPKKVLVRSVHSNYISPPKKHFH